MCQGVSKYLPDNHACLALDRVNPLVRAQAESSFAVEKLNSVYHL